MSQVIIFFIRLYQIIISPFFSTMLGPTAGCRFYISCSEYSIYSLKNFGVARGALLSARRIIKCRP